jgi:hypothetical protein
VQDVGLDDTLGLKEAPSMSGKIDLVGALQQALQ